jgi:hypothetical protein
MKNKAIKSIGVLALASLMTTTAFSQVTISGYTEVGFLTGGTNGTLAAQNNKGLGNETVITIAGKGTMTNGWTYSAYQNFDSDDDKNGRNTANVSPMTTRALEISPSKDFKFFYTYDGVYGGEIARTSVPTVTDRVADQTGNSGLSEFIDVTSGTHAIGVEALNLGPAGRLSVAYAANLDSMPQASSDRSYSATGQINYVAPASGYSIGYTVTPGPIKIAAGLTKIDQKQAANAQDATSKTLGIQYIDSAYAIGAQRTKNDGLKAALTTPATFSDQVDTFAASFAVNKEITLGATYSKMERSGTAITTQGPDLKVYQAVVAYNLGPVVASIMYEDAKDRPISNGATTSGLDATTTKIKVKANF